MCLQVGPRTNFATAWAANAASICASVGLTKVTRLEASRRFGLKSSQELTPTELSAFAALVHDRMTEEVHVLNDNTAIHPCCHGAPSVARHTYTRVVNTSQVYPEPLQSFASDAVPGPVFTVPVVEQGRAALEAIDKVRRIFVCDHAVAIASMSKLHSNRTWPGYACACRGHLASLLCLLGRGQSWDCSW